MPVQNIHFHGGHAVQVALEDIERDEVATDVDQHAAPGGSRLIFDGDCGNGESGRSDLGELGERGQSAQYTERRRSIDLRARGSDGQFVRFILSQLLYGFSTVIGVNRQDGWRSGFRTERNAGLRRKLLRESLDSCIERRIVIARDLDRKRLVDRQLSRGL